MQLEMLGAMMPDAVNQPVETQQQWACDMDVAAHWPLAALSARAALATLVVATVVVVCSSTLLIRSMQRQ